MKQDAVFVVRATIPRLQLQFADIAGTAILLCILLYALAKIGSEKLKI